MRSDPPRTPRNEGDVEPEDSSFDALLREAAHVPPVMPRSARPRIGKGTALLEGRFVVRRFLGEGGMGVVYEAEDRERRERVALKTLPFIDDAAIYRLKQEFRSLSHVVHPHLVGLHELFVDEERWFFTMDLVKGLPLLEYLGEVLDVGRLKRAFSELAVGVRAIHEAGKLHRDLKPTNVMVTRNKRVVIMDFGLVSDQEVGGAGQTVAEESVSGTPLYMAPEQAVSEPATEASDWYAFGVMLFEALTGKTPFRGSSLSVLTQKQQRDAPLASTLRGGLPEDLVALAAGLLARSPESRPRFEDVMAVLGRSHWLSEAPPRTEKIVFVGRERELAELWAAFEVAESGEPTALFVHGPSGVGKSALVEHFLKEVEEKDAAVVLTGRCYERESVPYKACDSLVDALSRYLKKVSQERAATLIPRNVHALARLFPAIGRLQVVTRMKQRRLLPADPVSLKRQAVGALKELLSNLAAQEPLAIYVDDLQWSDVDGATLLSYLLSPPEPPVLLFVGAYRSEEAKTSDGLQTLLTDLDALKSAEVREIALGNLSDGESESLAREMLPDRLSDQARPLAVEAEGNPFFITQLARYVTAAPMTRETVSLERVVESRLAELPPDDRRLIEALCIATAPSEPELLASVTGVKEVMSGLRRLQGGALVRYASGSGTRFVAYHDRIRETVILGIEEPMRQAWHAKWAAALEESPAPDVDALYQHFLGAKEKTRTLIYAERAADHAVTGLAFDRAAAIYEHMLTLLPDKDERRGEIHAKLAQALADAGRSRDSATVFVKAAEYRSGKERAELSWRAAEQALMGGDFEIAKTLLRETLPHFGIRMPRGKWSAITGLVRNQTRLALIKSTPPKKDKAVSEDDRRRIEICTTLAYLLYFYDPLLGFYFINLSALYRLRSHNLTYRPVGLVMKALNRTLTHPEREENEQILSEAITLARERADAPELAHTLMHAGVVWTNLLKPLDAAKVSLEAERLIRQHCTGAIAVYGIQMVQQTLAAMYFYSSDYKRQRLVIEQARTENLRHRSLFHDRFLDVMEFYAKLAADDPDAARRNSDSCHYKRSPGELTFIDICNLMSSQVILEVFLGRPEQAYEYLESRFRDIKKTGLLRSKSRFSEIYWWRGISALAAGLKTASLPVGGETSRNWLALARSHAGRLKRLDFEPALATSNALFAGLAAHAGEREEAVLLLREGADIFKSHGQLGLAAGARRCVGNLIGGEEGHRLINEADSQMIELGVKNPARMTAAYFPGFSALSAPPGQDS